MRFLALSLTALSAVFLTLLPASRSLAQAGSPLTGVPWRLVAYGEPGAETPVLAGTIITIQFEDGGRAGGEGGCNRYSTSYTLQDDAIVFGGVASTRKACPDQAIMRQENAYFQALQAAQRYTLEGDQLVIVYGAGEQLVFKRVDALAGSQWRLVAYGAADAETPVPAGSVVTLLFDENGRAGGSGGCNSYSGSYTAEGDAIRFGQMVSTLMACAEEVMQQERAYLNALQAAARYELADDTLVIRYGDGEQLVFKRLDPLAGSQWQLASFGAPDAVWPPSEGSVITLAFDDDGRVAGSSGCNSYGGSYTLTSETIQFSQLFSTKRACPDTVLMEQEARYLMILGSASRYSLADDQLTIVTNGGGRLVFQPLPQE